MKTLPLSLLLLFPVAMLVSAQSCPEGVSFITRAGSGFSGYIDGQGVETMFNRPTAIAANKDGTLYVYDEGNNRIRVITASGLVTTHPAGPVGGWAMVVDSDGNLFLSGGDIIKKVTPQGVVTTFASGFTGGLASNPGMALLGDGRMAAADAGLNKIFIIGPDGQKTLLAGSGNIGSVDGKGVFCSFNRPTGIAVRPDGMIVVCEVPNSFPSDVKGLRLVSPDGTVTTLAGSLAFTSKTQLLVGKDGTIWGSRYPDGTQALRPSGTVERFDICPSMSQYVGGIAMMPSGEIAFTDYNNHLVRILTTPMELPVEPAALTLASYAGITLNGIAGRTYRIEAATEAGGAWEPVSTNTIPSAVFRWIDPAPMNSRRIYRAVLLQ